jgi:NADH dehydrogenase [ubiquinone] 1 alpha subcomplex assembly factor 6
MATIPGYGGGTSWRTSVRSERSSGPERLSAIAATLRRCDRDRFQTALFAPAAEREALFALYAFNCEIARVRESVSQPMLGRIRLEWWREAIAEAYAEVPPRRHPLVAALTTAIRARRPAREHFERIIDARQADLADEPPSDLAALEEYAEATSSRLILIALELLGIDAPAVRTAAHHVGIAYAFIGLLRAMPMLLPAGRRIIPAEIVRRHGLDRDDWRAWGGSAALRTAVAEIAGAANSHLRTAGAARAAVPRAAVAALLPAVVARQGLKRLARASHDPFAPQLARADPWQGWRLAGAALRHRF